MRLPHLDTQDAFLPFSFLVSLIPTFFSILCTTPKPKHNSILDPGRTTNVELLKQVKNWQSPSRDPWSNCLINSRETTKGQTYYYSDRQKVLSNKENEKDAKTYRFFRSEETVPLAHRGRMNYQSVQRRTAIQAGSSSSQEQRPRKNMFSLFSPSFVLSALRSNVRFQILFLFCHFLGIDSCGGVDREGRKTKS